MAVAQIYTAVPNDVITAARWNNEFGNIYNNGTAIAFPVTTAVSFAGMTITLDAAGATTLVSSASQGINVTPGAKAGTPNTTGKSLNVVANTFTDTATAGSGTATAFAATALQQPTLAAQNSSVTCTDAATLYVSAAPANGTNVTITNPWAIWVDAGNVRFDGGLTLTGTLALSGIITGGQATTSQSGTVELLTQAEYDAATDTTRVPTASLKRVVLGTPIATTSGTSHDFTGIPAGTSKINVMLTGVSGSGTSLFLIQLGDSGGIETSGYLSAGDSFVSNGGANRATSTAGFVLHGLKAATGTEICLLQLVLQNAATFTWVGSGGGYNNTDAQTTRCAGSKSLSAELTQIRLTHVNGTDTFDAGTFNISYER